MYHVLILFNFKGNAIYLLLIEPKDHGVSTASEIGVGAVERFVGMGIVGIHPSRL